MKQENGIESACKNCNHPMESHKPNCKIETNDSSNEINVCGCSNPQYYNTIISGKYIGWTEIHCNCCGVLLGFIDSTSEDIYDSVIFCQSCIKKNQY